MIRGDKRYIDYINYSDSDIKVDFADYVGFTPEEIELYGRDNIKIAATYLDVKIKSNILKILNQKHD